MVERWWGKQRRKGQDRLALPVAHKRHGLIPPLGLVRQESPSARKGRVLEARWEAYAEVCDSHEAR